MSDFSLNDFLRQLNQGQNKNIGLEVNRSGPGTRARIASELLRNGRSVVILLHDAAELAEMRALLTLFSHTPDKLREETLPVWEKNLALFTPYAPHDRGKAALAERMASYYTMLAGRPVCVLLTPETFLLRTPPPDIFDNNQLVITKGMELSPILLMEQLVEWGYSRVSMVAEPGEFAARGDILDVFCAGYQKPIRMEFFGDLLEDLRLFNPSTQRSSKSLSELLLIPSKHLVYSLDLRKRATELWTSMLQDGRLEENDIYSLNKYMEAGDARLTSGMYYEKSALLDDWLPGDTTLLLPGRNELKEWLEESGTRWQEILAAAGREGADNIDAPHQPAYMVMRNVSEVLEWCASSSCIYFESLRVGIATQGKDFQERSLSSFQDLFPQPADLERPWQRLVIAMQKWSSGEEAVLLSFSSERSRAKFLDLARQDGIVPQEHYTPGKNGLYALVSSFRQGLHLLWENVLVLGENILQPRGERVQRPSGEAFRGLERYDDLQEGDLLVHRDYGICAFGGLHRLQLDGIANDFLLLRYSGEDKLYLPVDRLGLVQVFKAPDGLHPALDKLGGNQWSGSKEKARKAIEKIAEELVEMYAYRKVAKGFSYGPVNEMYREFEATFGFEETPDQARAIIDVLEDMGKPEPMDRLVCGDVGFGKTEVALRASFRAALEGRQVVMLCPTTVLAEQHYQTFRTRLAGFPVNVGLLSRFVPRGKQKEVLEAASRGQIDILIGTHRLLSKDVILPNLGLIVMDEEQRFGVKHKEFLKHLRKNVDVLTLTATPIPRTLQLSLSGVRELSVIETPPAERKPVSTALINRDDAALRMILERELARQGQVFWVYNRVQGLERTAEYVQKLVPEAKIGMAHGQMGERALEENMRRFWHGEIDVLVCTAIVESGLDFPRANTLVVDQAQMFGLGQLYQLRGRVGRSDRQAFAVFVCPDVERLPKTTRERMRIILELDHLGAGFQVAMEDLRLRGAGNILGESQSGHMQRLGLDMFLEMLEAAVAKMRGQPMHERLETEINLGVPAYIPEKYIEDSRERLRYYKALSSARDSETQRDVEFELRDRFGPVPEELDNFFSLLNFKRHLSDWGVLKADIFSERVRLTFSEKYAKFDPSVLVSWVYTNQQKAKLLPPAVLDLTLAGGSFSDKLSSAYAELLPLMQNVNKS